MTISAATAPGENCTEDLLLEILLRLPVKSLHRFKAVSKTWLSLITSSSFVKSQLRHAMTSNAGDDDKTVLVNLYKDYENRESEDVSFALLRPSSGQLVADLKLPYSEHDHPDAPRSFVVGSDIGVVCVVVCYNYDSYVLYLWNPATKQSKLIPELYVYERECFGFGFDPIDSDFKVVKTCMGQYTNYEGYCCAVYSAKEDSWRLKPNPPDVSTYDGYDVCLHGFLCSIGEHGMVAFDLNKEVFICNVKLPAVNDVSRAFRACLTDLKDSIAFVFSKHKGDKTNFWTLDDEACLAGNGLEASWTLMLSIDHVALPVQFVKGYLHVGDFKLVSESEDRCLYNTYKNGAGKIRFQYETFKAFKYTETLVSIA